MPTATHAMNPSTPTVAFAPAFSVNWRLGDSFRAHSSGLHKQWIDALQPRIPGFAPAHPSRRMPAPTTALAFGRATHGEVRRRYGYLLLQAKATEFAADENIEGNRPP